MIRKYLLNKQHDPVEQRTKTRLLQSALNDLVFLCFYPSNAFDEWDSEVPF